MPSYMTIVVIALAASNVSAALPVSVPVQKAREQSLSRREPPGPPPNTPPPGYPPPGYPPPGTHESETKPLLPENSVPSDKGHVEPPKEDKPAPKGGSNWKGYIMNFVVGTAATMVGASILKAIVGSFSSSAPSRSANQNSQSNSYPPGYISGSSPSGQNGPGIGPGQYQYQQRDVDHGKRADFFAPSEAKDRSIFDNNRRATSHLELLARADVEEALNLFTRVLDELD